MQLVPILIIAAVAYAIGAMNAASINSAWAEGARLLQATLKLAGIFANPRIDGPRGLVIRGWRGRNSSSTTYEMTGGPAAMNFTRSGNWADLTIATDRVHTGDAAFDQEVRLSADAEDVAALMDEDTRAGVLSFVRSGGEMKEGKLRLRRSGLQRNPLELARIGTLMLTLGDRLAREGRKKLLQNTALNDSVPQVRARALGMLVDHFPKTPEARAAVEAALDDADATVRTLAARQSGGDRGMRILRGVVADARLEADARLAAFNWLLSLFGYPADLAAGLLEAPDWTLQRAAVVAVRNARDTAQLDRVCALTREEPPELAQAAATALGVLGDARAAPHLIALLGHREEKVQMAAAGALGAIGDIGAVEPLLPLTKGLFHADLHAAARDAVRRIQARLGDAGAGRLSVAETGPEGALSESGESGEISLIPGTRTRS